MFSDCLIIGFKKEEEEEDHFTSLGLRSQFSKLESQSPSLPLHKDVKRMDVRTCSKESPSFNLNKTFYKTSALSAVW